MARAAATADARQLEMAFVPPPPGAGGGRLLAQHNGVSYVELRCRSILNWVDGQRASSFYSVNPYRGCEFGCAYCYARYTHEYLDLGTGDAFERRVHVKVNAPEALARDLRRCRVLEHKISFGSATDPYQPAERHFGLTRKLLEGLLPYRGLAIGIVTKSGLVMRDATLLRELAQRHDVHVMISCITLDPSLQRLLEPRAAAPAKRLEAMSRLSALGLRTSLIIAPVLPGIVDAPADLRRLCSAARAAGASAIHHQVLFLPRPTRSRFFEWLERHRPELATRYRRAFGQGREVGEAYHCGFAARLGAKPLGMGSDALMH